MPATRRSVFLGIALGLIVSVWPFMQLRETQATSPKASGDIFSPGAWRLSSSTAPSPMASGAYHVTKTLAGPKETSLNLVFFDSTKVSIEVVEQPTRASALPAKDYAAKVASSAIALCNGGYFSVKSDFLPSGLQIVNGLRTGTKGAMNAHVGQLVVTEQTAALIWDPEFKDSTDIKYFVQCSPWLVSDGKPWPATEPEYRYKRTFIATDGGSHWCMGVSSPLALKELIAILTDAKIISEMKIQRALNLDGGPSTSLCWRTEDGSLHDVSQPSLVRNFVVLKER